MEKAWPEHPEDTSYEFVKILNMGEGYYLSYLSKMKWHFGKFQNYEMGIWEFHLMELQQLEVNSASTEGKVRWDAFSKLLVGFDCNCGFVLVLENMGLQDRRRSQGVAGRYLDKTEGSEDPKKGVEQFADPEHHQEKVEFCRSS